MSQRPPLSEVQFRAVRSSGPGGQNVNKVASAAILKWSFWDSRFFSDSEKSRIQDKLANLINKNLEITLRSESSRDLLCNKEQAYKKLLELVSKALKRAKPRKKTKPSRSQKEKRLSNKAHQSAKKEGRKRQDW